MIMKWEPPKGVCAVVGANGSGKTRLVESFWHPKLDVSRDHKSSFYDDLMAKAFPKTLAQLEHKPSLGYSCLSRMAAVLSLMKPDQVVAIDEPEASLHPHVIRVFMHALEQLADDRGLAIVLATHSPVIVNALQAEQIFALREGAEPICITELHHPDWLAQFSLGDLFMQGEFD
jgi:predicted ATPase